jgi:glycogen synthase
LAIHNLAHQGSFEAHAFHEIGLPGDWYGTLEWENPDDRHRRKTVNILKVRAVCSGTCSHGWPAFHGMPNA